MANLAVIPNYEAMAAELGQFISKVSESCGDMEAAGKECVENCDSDEASVKSYSKLSVCIGRYRETLDAAQSTKAAIQEELEELYAIRDQINNMDD